MESSGSGPLTLPQVAQTAGVEYATLHSWVKRGLVSASLQTSAGTGTPNLFSRRDALTVRILADLRKAGVDLQHLERVARKLEANGEKIEGDGALVVNGSIDLVESNQSLDEVLTDREPAVVYQLAWAREPLSSA
jgi:DNA-binding transcriptional MerR regulator